MNAQMKGVNVAQTVNRAIARRVASAARLYPNRRRNFTEWARTAERNGIAIIG